MDLEKLNDYFTSFVFDINAFERIIDNPDCTKEDMRRFLNDLKCKLKEFREEL